MEDLPPQTQLLITGIISVLVALGAVYKFFVNLRKPPEPTVNADTLKILGASLGDVLPFDDLRNEMREIRSVMQRHLDLDQTGKMVLALERIAVRLEKMTVPRGR